MTRIQEGSAARNRENRKNPQIKVGRNFNGLRFGKSD